MRPTLELEARVRELRLIAEHRVTHFGGAPIVYSFLINAPDELYEGINHTIHCFTGGAAPPAAVIDAYNDVQRARADLERQINEAQGYRNDLRWLRTSASRNPTRRTRNSSTP